MLKNLTIRGLQIVAAIFTTIIMIFLIVFNHNQLTHIDESIDRNEILINAVMNI